MSRSRNIKPGFLLNDKLGELDPLARLLFIGFWTVADYKGEFEWREKRLKAQLLPYDDCDIKKLAINLDNSGFIRFYSDGAEIYCKVVNFNVHQNPHKNEREKGSDIPTMTESMRQAVDLKGLTINRDLSGLNQENSDSDPADSLFLIPDSCSLIPEKIHTSKPTVPPCPHLEIIKLYHEILPELQGVIASRWVGSSRATNLQARWREDERHQDLEFWKAYFIGIRKSDWHMGRDGGWKADLGWLVNRTNFDKRVEDIFA